MKKVMKKVMKILTGAFVLVVCFGLSTGLLTVRELSSNIKYSIKSAMGQTKPLRCNINGVMKSGEDCFIK